MPLILATCTIQLTRTCVAQLSWPAAAAASWPMGQVTQQPSASRWCHPAASQGHGNARRGAHLASSSISTQGIAGSAYQHGLRRQCPSTRRACAHVAAGPAAANFPPHTLVLRSRLLRFPSSTLSLLLWRQPKGVPRGCAAPLRAAAFAGGDDVAAPAAHVMAAPARLCAVPTVQNFHLSPV